jgi:hypothetical protein
LLGRERERGGWVLRVEEIGFFIPVGTDGEKFDSRHRGDGELHDGGEFFPVDAVDDVEGHDSGQREGDEVGEHPEGGWVGGLEIYRSYVVEGVELVFV